MKGKRVCTCFNEAKESVYMYLMKEKRVCMLLWLKKVCVPLFYEKKLVKLPKNNDVGPN